MAFRKVAEFKEVTFQYSSNGNSVLHWFTDMPGGALTDRGGANLPSTSLGRKTITVPLDGLEGTEFYPSIRPDPTTQLRIFSGVVWVRPIGVYVDGSLNEIWSTPPISIGT